MENKSLFDRLVERIRLSLVLKLNLRTLLRFLSTFIKLDLAVVLLVFAGTIISAELNIQHFVQQNYSQLNKFDEIENLPRNISMREAISDEDTYPGFQWDFIDDYTPATMSSVHRFLVFTDSGSFSQWITSLSYRVMFPDRVTIYYSLADFFYIGRYLLLVLAVIQFFTLIGIGFAHARNTRSTLRPIAELADNAHSVNGNDLDARLSIKGTQNELVDLAKAINQMLDRIQESYSSQVRFVSDASHELRTPIAVIQGYANLLDRWGKEDSTMLQEGIDAIKGETASMKDLVEQLLFLARGDNDTMQIHMEIFDISSVLKEVFNEAQMIDSAHTFEMGEAEPIFVQGDIHLTKQAVRILVDNAIKYTPSTGKIMLTAKNKDGRAVISIQDEGIGIGPDEVPHIFDRFYRADQARTRKGGSGLGLSIADWIVRRHGGQFEVVSREGIGTRISILFPVCQLPAGDLGEDEVLMEA